MTLDQINQEIARLERVRTEARRELADTEAGLHRLRVLRAQRERETTEVRR